MNVSVTVPPAVLKEVEQVAEREGKTSGEVMLEALRRYLIQSEIREAQRYGKEQSKKLGLKERDVERLIHEYRREKR